VASNITVILDSAYKRIAAIVMVIVIGLGFGWRITSDFIVRGVADPRVEYPREWLAAAAERYPNSARVNYRLASAEVSEATGSEQQLDALAEKHAARAVELNPWDYKARRLLATAQELNGKEEDAENSLRAAVRLAPNHAELNWSFANLLLRRGKLAEALGPFRIASKAKAGLLPSAIETIWISSGEDLGVLKTFAGKDTESLLAVVKFLTEQGRITDAVPIFNSIDNQAKVASPQSPELITTLLRAGQLSLAKATWEDLMASHQPGLRPEGGLVWNGGFESDVVEGLEQFNWVIRPNQYARIGFDRSVARTGARSLKVAFSGMDTTVLRDQIQQNIVLKPGAQYRLQCFVKVKDLATPEGPRVAVIGPGGVIAVSAPVTADSTNWRPLAIDFAAPANAPAAVLAVVRTPKFSYDDPTRGVIWFDDFTLIEQ
jgi:tetratricopeptide (TPR) repeat protein